MENQEIYQPDLEKLYTEVTEVNNSNGNGEKPCTTCKKKSLSKSNIKILLVGVSILFLSFYGILTLVKDIISQFTR